MCACVYVQWAVLSYTNGVHISNIVIVFVVNRKEVVDSHRKLWLYHKRINSFTFCLFIEVTCCLVYKVLININQVLMLFTQIPRTISSTKRVTFITNHHQCISHIKWAMSLMINSCCNGAGHIYTDKQLMLGVGDLGGTLHILEVPWSLRHPSSHEVCI